MSHKVCYITTLPVTLKAFVLKSAVYNTLNEGWNTTFICNTTEGFQKELPNEIRYIPVPIKRGFSLTGLKSIIDLYKVFKKERFDLVQYSTMNASCYASIAAKLAKIPVRLYCQWGLDYMCYPDIKGRVLEIIERVICKCSTHIQPDSFGNLELSYKEILYDETKGEVIGFGSASGVDISRFDLSEKSSFRTEIRIKHGIPADSFVFGYVGRMLKDKGINELLTAFFKLAKIRSDIKLLMVGPTDLVEGIDSELWQKAQACSDIIFSGFTKEVPKYLSAMDCFVLPSYHEGFGSSLIEAEAMEVAVITTDIPGPREAIKNSETGVLIEKANSNILFDAMNAFCLNPDKTAEYGVEGRKYVVTRFDDQKLFAQILENRRKLLMGVNNEQE